MPPHSAPFAAYVPRVAREWIDSGAGAELHRCIQGSVVFVDVSGFTRMSERLARLGKVGAEHVTDVIGTCFSRLLADAYSLGATLLKFGGDALLLFFSGARHEPRAAAAALEMRRTLRAMGTTMTEAGAVSLRMTAGVHSGNFDFFLVGGSHRELIVAGPTATAAAAIEAAARTGQILIGPSTAAALRAENIGPVRGPGRLLRGQLSEDRGDGVQFYTARRDLTPLVPVALRDVIAAGGAPSEHRRVTIAFVAFHGLDSVIEQSGADVAAKLLDELVRSVQQAVDARGVCFLGTDIAPDGGKFILTAGVPVGHGEDEERMLLALRELIELDPILPIRIGVNTGHAFAGEIGTMHRQNYTVMGDAVNLAARVMGRADDGQILACCSTVEPSRTLFETQAIEPFFVKGKRSAVSALSVGPVRGVRSEIAAGNLPLVGRDKEIEIVLDLASRLPNRSGAIVELVGQPGAGKSRFVAEIERRAAPVPLRRVQCRLYQAATPYFPFRQLLADLVGIDGLTDAAAAARLASLIETVAPDLAPVLPLLAVALGLEIEIGDSPEPGVLDEKLRKRRLELAVVQLLERLVDEPTIFCFEDVHWMDEPSRDLVSEMARACAHRPWLLCVTRREGEPWFVDGVTTSATRIQLEPLAPEASAALIVAASGTRALPSHVVQALAVRADGNPLFLLELLNALHDGNDIESLPSTIEGLITARIDRLPRDDRSQLRNLSVLGIGFREEHAAAVDVIDRASLRRLTEFLVADSSGWVTFRHALVRDVAYGGLPYRIRTQLHGQVADSILRVAEGDTGDDAALLSLHFLRAQRYGEAWHYSRVAADAARALYANLEATTLYERATLAARHLEDLPAAELAEVIEALADVQELAGLYAESRGSYAIARRHLVDAPIATARVMLKEAFVAERRGQYIEAIRAIRRGQRLLEGVPDPEADAMRAQLAVWFAAIRADQGRLAEAARAAREAVGLAQDAGDEHTLARGMLVLDYTELALGVSRRHERTPRALEIFTRLGDLGGQATAANNLGAVAYFDGRWDDAIEWYVRSREARLQSGDPVSSALADANIAEIFIDQGRFVEAEALLAEAAMVWTAAGDEWGPAFVHRLLGVVAARTTRGEEAAALLTGARAAFSAIGAQSDVAATDLAIVELSVNEGRGRDALELLERLEASGARGGALEPLAGARHRLLGVALLQVGEVTRGREELQAALALARAQENDYQIALALDAIDRLDGSPDGVSGRLRDEADGILARLGVTAAPVYSMIPSRTIGSGNRDPR